MNVDIRSSHAGVITKLFAEEGESVEVGGDFFEVDTAKSGEAPASPATPAAPIETKPAESKAAPVAAAPVTPVTPAPTKVAAPTPAPPVAKKPAAKKGKAPTDILGTRSETRVQMTRMRLRIAERLKDSQNTAAMLTTFNECDMSAFMDIRK